jgi:hypothetical protein
MILEISKLKNDDKTKKKTEEETIFKLQIQEKLE